VRATVNPARTASYFIACDLKTYLLQCAVDFELVLERLVEVFERLQIRYAAIGGFALGVLGAPRQTMDLDFLIDRDDLAKLDTALSDLGYTRLFRSENVSQFRHDDPAWGSLDFIHAFRKVSLAMLDRAKVCSVLAGRASMKTAQPEDVIGLKVQAMFNDPVRRLQEQRDIEALLGRYGSQLDWIRIQEFYDVFGLVSEAKELRRRFDRAQ